MLMIVRYNKYDYINILTLKLNLIPIKDHTSNLHSLLLSLPVHRVMYWNRSYRVIMPTSDPVRSFVTGKCLRFMSLKT